MASLTISTASSFTFGNTSSSGVELLRQAEVISASVYIVPVSPLYKQQCPLDIQLLEYAIPRFTKMRMAISRKQKELSEIRWWQKGQIFHCSDDLIFPGKRELDGS